MRTAQYVRAEKAIAAADKSGIRERWFYGLRALRDPEVMTKSGKSMQHGATDKLILAAAKAGEKLTPPEIRYRIQCARTYQKESQIATACGDFKVWSALRDAGFPHYDAPAEEPLADWRTVAERAHERALELAEKGLAQEALFPLDQYEPAEATLKDLVEYADRQDGINESFMATARRRRAYLKQLIDAAGGDLSVTWQAAQALLPDDEPEALP